MRKRRFPFQFFIGLLFATIGHSASGQWLTGAGYGYLAPGTTRINVGNTASGGSLLTVDGAALANGETFRTISPGGTPNLWRMYVGTATEYGRIWAPNNPTQRPFNIESLGHLKFWGQSQLRMQLNKVQNSTINGYNVPTSGFFGISGVPAFFTPGATNPGPFTRVHLVDSVGSSTSPIVYAQEFGYRPWQRNGITFTGNSDQGYVGQKYNGSDRTDMVFSWSDNQNAAPWGTDRMRWLFTTTPVAGATTGAESLEGLEVMRLYPFSKTQGYLGLGDFFASGGDPTERFDILNGKMRHRQLPTDPVMDTATKVMVVNANGIVGWRPYPTGGGGGIDCDWVVNPVNGDVFTGNGPLGFNPGCPDVGSNVGIGTGAPLAKFDIRKTIATPSGNNIILYGEHLNSPASSAITQGLRMGLIGGAALMQAVSGTALVNTGTCNQVTGTRAEATGNATATVVEGNGTYGTATQFGSGGTFYGARGTARSYNTNAGALTTVYGTYGLARADDTTANVVIGCYGGLQGLSGSNDYAGKFDGPVIASTYSTSDESLKTNIQESTGAMDRVLQMRPVTFDFLTEENESMHLPTGNQVGLLAGELELIRPDLVRSAMRPATHTEDGGVLQPAMQYKVLRMEGIVPDLIGSTQQLYTQAAALQTQLAAVQEQLAETRAALEEMRTAQQEQTRTMEDCCNRMQVGSGISATGGKADLLIIPNPVANQTLLRYTLATAGRARLEVSANDGRVLEVLLESAMQPGTFDFTWNTTSLAAGMYNVALIVDGNVIVKKAVKVGDR